MNGHFDFPEIDFWRHVMRLQRINHVSSGAGTVHRRQSLARTVHIRPKTCNVTFRCGRP